MINEAFQNGFDIESKLCMKHYTLKDLWSIEHIFGNAALRNSGISESLYLVDFNMLVGLGEEDSDEEIEDARQKKNSFCWPKFQKKQKGIKCRIFLLKRMVSMPAISASLEILF